VFLSYLIYSFILFNINLFFIHFFIGSIIYTVHKKHNFTCMFKVF
jgi:hypothetical protein